jgi:hypothetical protein
MSVPLNRSASVVPGWSQGRQKRPRRMRTSTGARSSVTDPAVTLGPTTSLSAAAIDSGRAFDPITGT